MKPDARGELTPKHKPYSGKFFMSGAAAGRVFVFDPELRLAPAQYAGNVLSAIPPEEWAKELAPFIGREARRRGAPIRIEGEHITLRLDGEWRRWRYDEAFSKLSRSRSRKRRSSWGSRRRSWCRSFRSSGAQPDRPNLSRKSRGLV